MADSTKCSTCGAPLGWSPKGFPSCPNWATHKDRPNRNRPEKAELVRSTTNYEETPLSDQQFDIVNGIVIALNDREEGDYTTRAVEVQALAGSGKTYTAMSAIARISSRWRIGYGAFNRANADEALTKMPHGKADTLHKLLGMEAIRAVYPKSRPDRYKPYNIAEQLLPKKKDGDDFRARNTQRRQLVRLMNLCMDYLHDGERGSLLEAIIQRHEIDLSFGGEEMLDLLPEAIRISFSTLKTSMSFGDMMAAPCMIPKIAAHVPFFHALVVDEAQDLTPAQHALALMATGFVPQDLIRFGVQQQHSLDELGLLVVIGDPNQAIYAFRGALSDSMEQFRAKIAESGGAILDFPLTETFRCPRRVVELAQRIVPNYTWLPDAREGRIRLLGEEIFTEELLKDPRNSLVLCRTFAPLARLGLTLIRQGHSVYIENVDFDAGLSSLIQRMQKLHTKRGGTAMSCTDLIMLLNTYLAEQTAKLTGSTPANEELLISISDRVDTLIVIASAVSDVAGVLREINRLFVSDKDAVNPVHMMTAHRAKGREAFRIFCIGCEKMPHILAKTPESLRQELNLIYVMITRVLCDATHEGELFFLETIPAPLIGDSTIEVEYEGSGERKGRSITEMQFTPQAQEQVAEEWQKRRPRSRNASQPSAQVIPAVFNQEEDLTPEPD